MASNEERDMKSPVSPAHDAPPSYERSASPSATAPSTLYNGEVDTGPRALQPDNTYAHGSQSYQNPQQSYGASPPQGYTTLQPQGSISPPPQAHQQQQGAPGGGYYQPPPPSVPQPQHPQHPQPQQPQHPYPQPQQQQHPQHPNATEMPTPMHNASQGGSQMYKNVTPIYALTSASAPVECPACGARTLTKVNLVTGNTTHAWAAGVCLVLCLGCIPYCVSSTKDVEQKCGNCGVMLATWHRSGRTEVHVHS